jgi:hypothetical protein
MRFLQPAFHDQKVALSIMLIRCIGQYAFEGNVNMLFTLSRLALVLLQTNKSVETLSSA